jgi:hypothetical protein
MVTLDWSGLFITNVTRYFRWVYISGLRSLKTPRARRARDLDPLQVEFCQEDAFKVPAGFGVLFLSADTYYIALFSFFNQVLFYRKGRGNNIVMM